MRTLSILALTAFSLAGLGLRFPDATAAAIKPQTTSANPAEHDATATDLAALAGKELHLTKLMVEGQLVSTLSGGPPVTLEVQAEGQLMGRGPVNRYSGIMHLGEHGDMTWARPLRSTKMASTRERMQLENQFMTALGSSKHLVCVGNGFRFESAGNSNVVEFLLP